MLFPVYPNVHRQLARRMLKARFVLLPLFVIGVLLFGFGAAKVQGDLMIFGVLIGTTGFMFFGTFGARMRLCRLRLMKMESAWWMIRENRCA